MDGFMRALVSVWTDSGFAALTWQNIVMILVGLVLLYLAIAKEYEPLLLMPIAFGGIMANFPNTGFETDMGVMMAIGYGIKYEIFPPLIFMGVGAMTDFGPLIANPKTMLLGAAAQIGVFVALAGAMALGFNVQEAASIGIIGGADGPTAIYLTSKLAPHLLGAIAVAAYSYMSLVPLIQPPIMKLCTTKEQRKIKMVNLRPVTHFEKVAFPIVVAIVVSLLLPPVASLMGMLCLGNLFEVSGVTARLSDTAQNALCTSGGSYIPGQGGGAAAQHGQCADIPWEEVQPGDLVFYPEDDHVGIAAGRDGQGRLLVVHCAAGAGGVTLSCSNGFTQAARPGWYGEE